MRLAVVGTDTGVGKTVVTAGLVGWLRGAGVDARAVKPVQTGFPPDDDAAFVVDACRDAGVGWEDLDGGGDDVSDDGEEPAVALRRLAPPLAPRVAAEREGVDLDFDAIREECAHELDAAEVGVLEGIGGLRVPLAGDRDVIDLVADLDATALVVARSGLGTLNHSGLSVEALRRHGVQVHAVVLDEYEGATVAERTNPAELERMTGVDVFTLPPLALDEPGDAVTGVREYLPAGVFPETVRNRL